MTRFPIPPEGGEELDREHRHRVPVAQVSRARSGARHHDRRQTELPDRWRQIEVRHLAALIAVAREGSFRRAADRLGYVQSAISNQIVQLERAAGTRLVERASGSATVHLTSAGDVLAAHADEILVRLEAARADVDSLAEGMDTVRVAGLEQLAPQCFAQILRRFRERHPLARVSLEDASIDKQDLERLNAGLIDLVICDPQLIDGPFSHVTFAQDPYVLLVAANSPLARRRSPPSATDIATLRLMIPAVGGAERRAEARLRELGIEARFPLSPGSVASAQAFVAAGLGQAIVPRSQLDLTYQRNVVAIELRELLPGRVLSLVFHAERECPRSVRGFIDVVRTTCAAERRRAGPAAA